MLPIPFAYDQVGGIDQAAIVPADKFRTRKGPPEKFSGPFRPLFEVVGHRAVGSRHGVGDHRERRIAIDERLIGDLRPAIQPGLLHFVSRVHLIKHDVGQLARDGQYRIERIRVGIDLVADEQMIGIASPNRIPRRLVVLRNDFFEELDIIARFVSIGKVRVCPPVLGGLERVKRIERRAISRVEIADPPAVDIARRQ